MTGIIAVYELQDVRAMLDLYVYSYLRTCAAYDSTVKSMGFDEVRVGYRQQRRELIRQVITKELSGTVMQQHVETMAIQLVPTEARDAFIEDALEDLRIMDESRLAGLGVSREQLYQWQKERLN